MILLRYSLLALTGTFCLTLGCQTTPQSDQAEDETPAIGMTPVPTSQTAVSGATIAVWKLGSIEYDMAVLPLISPNGRFLAVESGVAPTWPMLLAQPGVEPSSSTRIKIWKIDPVNRTMKHHQTVDQPLLLGRASTDDGFLVESLRADGARWIGMVHWNSGNVDWIIRNEHTNTQAAIGPSGQLAYSRRLRGGSNFELVVRTGASQWVQNEPSTNLLMPIWSGHNDGLFYVSLKNGLLDLVYAEGSSAAAARQSRRKLPLTRNATIDTAYQMLIGQPASATVISNARESLLFFHPSRHRMAMWAPFAGPEFAPLLLAPGSIGASTGPTLDTVLVATKTQLIRQSLEDVNSRVSLISGLEIPRATANAQVPYLLFSPKERTIAISAFRELPDK